MSPLVPSDGHDAPRLIAQFIPGAAAEVDDLLAEIEDAVGEPIVAHVLPTFSVGFNLGALAGKGRMVLLSGSFSLGAVCQAA
jgi:hypothetical protein